MEKKEEEPWTTNIMFDCILDKKSQYLNQHVRILKTPQEDYEEYKQPSSPAKVASMRIKNDDTSSNNDDSSRLRKKKIDKKVERNKIEKRKSHHKTRGESDNNGEPEKKKRKGITTTNCLRRKEKVPRIPLDAFDSEESDASVVVVDTPPKMKTDSDMDISNEKKTDKQLRMMEVPIVMTFSWNQIKKKLGKTITIKIRKRTKLKQPGFLVT